MKNKRKWESLIENTLPYQQTTPWAVEIPINESKRNETVISFTEYAKRLPPEQSNFKTHYVIDIKNPYTAEMFYDCDEAIDYIEHWVKKTGVKTIDVYYDERRKRIPRSLSFKQFLVKDIHKIKDGLCDSDID